MTPKTVSGRPPRADRTDAQQRFQAYIMLQDALLRARAEASIMQENLLPKLNGRNAGEVQQIALLRTEGRLLAELLDAMAGQLDRLCRPKKGGQR
jgi:hypothetical protein